MAATALVIASCNLAGGDEYANIATEMCECVNKSSNALSPEFKDAIIMADGDLNKFQTSALELQRKNPEKFQKELQEIMQSETCMNNIELKYQDLYTREKKEVVQDNLLNAMKENGDCKFTYSLIKIVLSAQK